MGRLAYVVGLLLLAAPLQAQTTRDICLSGCDHTTIQACLDVWVAGDTCTADNSKTYSESPTITTTGTDGNVVTLQGQAETRERLCDGIVRTPPLIAL